MIKFIKRYFIHKDARGFIEGLINFGNWEEFNLIYSEADCIRGNHYHKETIELFIILDGEIKVTVQKVENNQLISPKEVYNVKKGNVFQIEVNTNHIFKLLTNSTWLNILSKTINKEKPDIHRLEL